MNVIWTELALRRASDAVDWIALDRPAVASVWLEELLSKVQGLCEHPQMGRLIPELADPAYREIQHSPYRILYRLDSDTVVILTLRHSRRAWEASEVLSGDEGLD